VIPLECLCVQAVLRDPLYPFLPRLFSGAFTALALAVEWLIELPSGSDHSFEQHQSIPTGASR
jgi:hypothetical protein